MKDLFRGRRRHAPSDATEPDVEENRPCPHCGEPVSRGATVCMHCEQEIMPLMSYSEFALKFGSPHSGGPPHGVKGIPLDNSESAEIEN